MFRVWYPEKSNGKEISIDMPKQYETKAKVDWEIRREGNLHIELVLWF